MNEMTENTTLTFVTGIVDFMHVKKAMLTLRAINHTLRQRILKLLEPDIQLTVTEISVLLDIDQPVASQHLAILRRACVVKTVRSGKNISYEINHEKLEEITMFIKYML